MDRTVGMFANVLKEHKVKRQRVKQELENRKRDVTVSVENMTAALTYQLNSNVSKVAQNQNTLV
jgi:hypothetical protein